MSKSLRTAALQPEKKKSLPIKQHPKSKTSRHISQYQYIIDISHSLSIMEALEPLEKGDSEVSLSLDLLLRTTSVYKDRADSSRSAACVDATAV